MHIIYRYWTYWKPSCKKRSRLATKKSFHITANHLRIPMQLSPRVGWRKGFNLFNIILLRHISFDFSDFVTILLDISILFLQGENLSLCEIHYSRFSQCIYWLLYLRNANQLFNAIKYIEIPHRLVTICNSFHPAIVYKE